MKSGTYLGPCILLAVFLSGCGSDVESVEGGAGSLWASNISVNVNTEKQITINNAVGAVTYSLISGDGTVNSTTGAYFSPAVPGSARVRATDSRGRSTDVVISVGGSALFNMFGYDGASPTSTVYKSFDGNVWVTAGNLAANRGCAQASAVVAWDSIWFVAGWDGVSVKRDVLKTRDGASWTVTGQIPAARGCGVALFYNQKLWQLGGSSDNGNNPTSGQSTVYSSSDGVTWALAGNMPAARTSPSAVVYQNKMWIAGGTSTGSAQTDTVWSSTDGATWSVVGTLPATRTSGAMAVFLNKMFFVGGGTGGVNQTTVWSSTDGITWNVEGNLPAVRQGGNLVVFQDRLYYIGGHEPPYKDTVWATSDGVTWNSIGTMPGNSAWGGAVAYTTP